MQVSLISSLLKSFFCALWSRHVCLVLWLFPYMETRRWKYKTPPQNIDMNFEKKRSERKTQRKKCWEHRINLKERVRRKGKCLKRKAKWSEGGREEERQSEEVPLKFLSLSPPLLSRSVSFSLFHFFSPFPSVAVKLCFITEAPQVSGKNTKTHTNTQVHTRTNTRTLSATHKGRAKSTTVDYRGRNSVLGATVWFLLCFVYVCVHVWVDGLGVWLPMFHFKHTHRDLFFASYLCLQCGLRPRTTALW